MLGHLPTGFDVKLLPVSSCGFLINCLHVSILILEGVGVSYYLSALKKIFVTNKK